MVGERGSEWRKSSFCQNSGCVEVRVETRTVNIRCSKCKGPVLMFELDEWRDFIAGVKAGEFDV